MKHSCIIFLVLSILLFSMTFSFSAEPVSVKVYGQVVSVRGQEIDINIGIKSGIKEKSKGKIFIIEKKSDGKEKIIYLASIEVLKTVDVKSTARVIEPKGKIQKGQSVVFIGINPEDIVTEKSIVLRGLFPPVKPVAIGVNAEAQIAEIIRLTKDGGCNIDPVWVPQGDRIYFASNRNNDYWNIYTMKTDGSDLIKLTRDVRRNFSPEICNDGSKIVFVSSRDQHEDIYVMNFDGAAVTRVTKKLNLNNASPAWSPDGRKIVFVSFSGSPMQPKADIYLVNFDGTDLERLTMSGDNFAPDWSPDGKTILFVSSRTGHEELYTFDLETQKTVQLTDIKAQIGSPEWSPDGSKIVFMMNKDYKSSYICLISSDGSHFQQLDTGSSYNYVPYWAPDGQSITYIASNKHIQDIYIMKLKWVK
ncbi:MAG: DUF5050 domain-containing protein [Candidatus Eremiobacterota bacterium]